MYPNQISNKCSILNKNFGCRIKFTLPSIITKVSIVKLFVVIQDCRIIELFDNTKLKKNTLNIRFEYLMYGLAAIKQYRNSWCFESWNESMFLNVDVIFLASSNNFLDFMPNTLIGFTGCLSQGQNVICGDICSALTRLHHGKITLLPLVFSAFRVRYRFSVVGFHFVFRLQ